MKVPKFSSDIYINWVPKRFFKVIYEFGRSRIVAGVLSYWLGLNKN